MPNTLYALGRQGFLDGSLSWTNQAIKVMLVSNSYTPNVTADEFVSDIPIGAIVARSAAMSGKSAVGGTANASNVTYSAVTGATVVFLVIYEDTGDDTTSRLIAIIDTANGLPVIPNGGDITIAWDTASNKIFTL